MENINFLDDDEMPFDELLMGAEIIINPAIIKTLITIILNYYFCFLIIKNCFQNYVEKDSSE